MLQMLKLKKQAKTGKSSFMYIVLKSLKDVLFLGLCLSKFISPYQAFFSWIIHDGV